MVELSRPDLSSLVARIVAGDSQAEESLLAYCAPRVRAMAVARTRNRDLAYDLTQEALLAVLQAARKGQIRDSERIYAFVCGVARNVINNHRRRTARRPEVAIEEESEIPALSAQDDHDSAERQRAVRSALAELGQADREVLLLTLVEGLKPGEIAEKTGLAPDVVRTRKSRAIKRVLDVLESRSQIAVTRHIQ